MTPTKPGDDAVKRAVELLPCPFCGGEPMVEPDHRLGSIMHKIECHDCGIQTMAQMEVDYPAAQWNARKPEVQDRAEALKSLYTIMSWALEDRGYVAGYDNMVERHYETIKAALMQPDAWRTIESAPRDGTPCLIAIAGGVIYVGWGKDGKWIVFDTGRGENASITPTHWMPLPIAPEKGGE